MKHEHFSPFTLSTFLTTQRAASRVMLPLLFCSECRRALETLSEWLEALDHFEPLVGPELVTRLELFSKLLRENDTQEERVAAIEDDEMYHHWGLTQLLIEESRTNRRLDPTASKELAELAVRIAALLDPAFYNPEWIADLCAVATVNLAEAQMADGDHETAKELLQQAAKWQLNGTLRPRIGRSVARLRARLLWELDRQDQDVMRILRELDLSELEHDSDEDNLLSWFFKRWRDYERAGEGGGPVSGSSRSRR